MQRFNGLMLRGSGSVEKVWCVAFPSEEVLTPILMQAHPGDLIFSHHPIDMRCGDPRGKPGAGFIPIVPRTLERLTNQQLSFYSCHVPLDIHTQISTSDVIVRAIDGRVVDQFLPSGHGYAGRLCDIPPIALDELIETCRQVLSLPYVDLQGNNAKGMVSRIAVVAGGGGDVAFYEEADRKGQTASLPAKSPQRSPTTLAGANRLRSKPIYPARSSLPSGSRTLARSFSS